MCPKHHQKQRARSYRQHEARNQKCRGRTKKPRVAEVTKTETSTRRHEEQDVGVTAESSAAKFYRGQVVTTSEQSTVESHTRAFHADSSYQAAGLEQQSDQSTCGKRDGRDFNKRGGERGRQPISFRSCEHTDQRAAQVASAPPGQFSDVKTKLMEVSQAEGGQKQSKVDQTQMRMAQSQDGPASQRREEVGKLQEDRSKAVIAKTISEATKAVEKASTEAQRRQRRHAVQSNEQSD